MARTNEKIVREETSVDLSRAMLKVAFVRPF